MLRITVTVSGRGLNNLTKMHRRVTVDDVERLLAELKKEPGILQVQAYMVAETDDAIEISDAFRMECWDGTRWRRDV